MIRDQRIFNPIKYRKCYNPTKKVTQNDRNIKNDILSVIHNFKSTKCIDEHYRQKKQQLKRQWMQIKNKSNLFHMQTSKNTQKDQQREINYQQKDVKAKNETNNFRYLRQQNQLSMSTDQINKLSKTQPTNFLSQSQLLSEQSLTNCPQLNMLNSTCPLQQLLVTSDKLSQYTNLNESPKKFVNQALNIDVSFSPPQKRRKTICSQTKTLNTQDQHQDQLNFKNNNKNTPKLNKSLMVQKIINLKKTFNKNHSITQTSKSQNIQKRIYYQINKQLRLTKYQQKSIQSLNFPLLQNQEHKKMSFNQLFQYEKKKMQNLKKLLNKTKLDDSIDLDRNDKKNKINNLDSILKSKNSLKKLICNEIYGNKDGNLLNKSESKKSYLLYPIKSKNPLKNKSLPSERKQISNHESSNPQKTQIHFPVNSNLSNLNVNLKSLSRQKQPKKQSKRRKKNSISQVTTYNFDYIQKQKPEIKQIRNKYLYSNKKNLNKEELPQSVVTILSVHGKQDSKTEKWGKKLVAESFVQKFLGIEKIPPSITKNIPKTLVKQTNQKYQKRKNYRTVETEKEKYQNNELLTFRQKFQPWQNQKQNYQILDHDICQFTK